MPAPFIFVTTHRISEGRLEEFTALAEQYLQFVEAHEPDMVAHYAYLDEDGTEVSLVQVHPDAASAERHMQVAGELIGRGIALTDATTRIEVYGRPGPIVGRAVAANAENGATVSVKATGLGHFTRRQRDRRP
jgi:hypothetical protein